METVARRNWTEAYICIGLSVASFLITALFLLPFYQPSVGFKADLLTVVYFLAFLLASIYLSFYKAVHIRLATGFLALLTIFTFVLIGFSFVLPGWVLYLVPSLGLLWFYGNVDRRAGRGMQA